MDPPQHRQYRNLVSYAFTPRAIERLRGRVAEITQDLLDEGRSAGRMDFATEFAYPLPTIVIAEMLGVPTSDRPLFKRWADELFRQQLSDADAFRSEEQLRNSPEIQRFTRIFEEMSDYFEHMLEERKRAPREDMMSELLAAEVIREAAHDPDVLAIKQTLYRVGKNSAVVSLLKEAVENGKQVAVLVELKARFDEENNIEWARDLEQTGVHVVYGLVGLKTHAKVALVVRKEGDGLRRYVHLGTGNYNATTARIYEDLCLLTSREDLVADASLLFNSMTCYDRNTYEKLIVRS
jgi:polyphosphate kinase